MVEEMGEMTLLKFCEIKRLWKRSQFHGDEAKRIDEFNVHFWNSKGTDFCAMGNNLWCDTIIVYVL